MEFDDAYANAAYIPDAEAYPETWLNDAAEFRARTECDLDLAYGDSPRQKLDLFYPQTVPKGLVVFVHGGYWRLFDKSYWSHLAEGAVAQGWAVAMPSYDLCPAVRITEIGQQIMHAIEFATDRIAGPVRLAGHSAGGHLVARVMSLPDRNGWQARVEKVLSISPVADIAPLMQTTMNADLRIDPQEAAHESPVHHPAPNTAVTVWVGAQERPVFLQQAHALSQAWSCEEVIDPGFHHFDIISGLTDPNSAISAALLT